MLAIACGSPVPPATDSGSGTEEASTSEGTTDDPTGTSTEVADSTGTGTTDDTGVDQCPSAEPGWRWVDRFEAEGSQTYVWVGAYEGGVLSVADQNGDPFTHVLRRHDISGQLEWEVQAPNGTEIEDLRMLPGGDAIVCGRKASPSPGVWLARYDSMGNEQWSVQQPLLFCRGVDVTASGDIVAGGTLNDIYNPDGLVALVRFDAMGTVLDTWTPDYPFAFGFYDVAAIGEDVVLLGAQDDVRFWLGRADASNQLVWEHVQEDMTELNASQIAVDPASGDIIVVGSSVPIGSPSDLAAWRFSSDGAEIWSVSYDLGGDGEYANQVRIAPSGNLVIVGGIGQADVYQPLITALGPAGDLLWWTSLEDGDDVFGTDLALDDCGGIYASGWGKLGGNPDHDGWVGRYVPAEGY